MADVRFVRDLRELPDHAFGTRSLTWWGVVGFMLIEGTGFALAVAAYFFLMSQEVRWPPGGVPPVLLWGTVSIAIMLLSEIPNVWIKRMAEAERLREVQIGLTVMSLFGFVLLGVRALEFNALNVSWDRNAYGSILWALLALHTTHLITDWVDTLVLNVLMFTRHVEGRRFVDTSENALYWHFVVGSWVLIHAVIYWVPRL